MAQKACIFGGAFDPPHSGHLQLAEEAIKQLNADILFWLPTYKAPTGKEFVADFSQRCQMLSLLLKDRKQHTVETLEEDLSGPSYALHSLRAMQKKYPQITHWYWLMGADNWNSFESWYEWKEILNLCQIAVYPRHEKEIKDFSHRKAIKIGVELLPLSSSAIRQELAKKTGLGENKIHQRLIHYIEQNNIY